MARKARLVIAGQATHLLVRGHNRQTIFSHDADCRIYLDWLRDAAKEFGCAVHAYAFMPNHAHILATPRFEYSLSKTMQSLGRRYAQYINRQQGTSGTIWEGRFCSSLIDPIYALRVQRYIELNPVRAGLESRAEDCKNTSYQSHIGGKGETWLTDHPSFWGLGNTPFERQLAWGVFGGGGGPHHEDRAITEHLIRSRPWVSVEFIQRNPKLSLDRWQLKPRGRPKKS